MFPRKLGKSGIETAAMGMGCWAIGGPQDINGNSLGWGKVDDDESTKALIYAVDHGITLIDTADSYGDGHSEEMVGKIVADKRDKVYIATKFGSKILKRTKKGEKMIADEQIIRESCEESLKRLNTDYIDLYQFHSGTFDLDQVPDIMETLEMLVSQGKIRWYGWSTDDTDRATAFSKGKHCIAIQQRLNIFEGDHATLKVCEDTGMASLNRSPLVMGLITGKFTKDSVMAKDDIRSRWWDFSKPEMQKKLKIVDKLKEIITSDGRTLVQGALGWIWAKSEVTIPIPGFKTVKQVEENVKSLEFGPLSPELMQQVDEYAAQIEWS